MVPASFYGSGLVTGKRRSCYSRRIMLQQQGNATAAATTCYSSRIMLQQQDNATAAAAGSCYGSRIMLQQQDHATAAWLRKQLLQRSDTIVSEIGSSMVKSSPFMVPVSFYGSGSVTDKTMFSDSCCCGCCCGSCSSRNSVRERCWSVLWLLQQQKQRPGALQERPVAPVAT